MSENNEDRRTRRTRQALEKALIQLVLEKGYDALTIEEITQRADVGRTTFYLHYRDKEDILMRCIDGIADDFIKSNPALQAAPAPQQPIIPWEVGSPIYSIIYGIFTHAEENEDLYRVMMRGEGGIKVSQRFLNIARERAIHYIKMTQPHPELPIDVIANFIASTLLGMLTWWLENNYPHPKAEMVKMFIRLTVSGTANA